MLCRPEVLVPRAWPGIVVPHSEGICSRPGAKGEEHWHESETWVIVSMLMLKYCVTLVKSLPLSGLSFPPVSKAMTYTSLGLHPLGYSWNLNLLSPGQKNSLLPYSVMCSSDNQRRVFTIKLCLAGREQCVLVSRTFCLMEQLTGFE